MQSDSQPEADLVLDWAQGLHPHDDPVPAPQPQPSAEPALQPDPEPEPEPDPAPNQAPGPSYEFPEIDDDKPITPVRSVTLAGLENASILEGL